MYFISIKRVPQNQSEKREPPQKENLREYKQSSQKGMLMFFKLWKKKVL